jgi:hypothetical protein
LSVTFLSQMSRYGVILANKLSKETSQFRSSADRIDSLAVVLAGPWDWSEKKEP